jgi:C4-dicarboxylate-specific signal transduction histidine kinase
MRTLGSLGARVLAACLIVGLVPLVLSATAFHWRSASLLEAYLVDNVGKTARAYAADLDLFLERQRVLLRSIPTLGDDPSALLRSAASGDPNVEALFLVDARGAVLAASRGELDVWALEACTSLLASPDAAMTHAGEGEAHEVVVAVERGTGVLCGQITFTLHQDMLTERADSIVGGTAYIIDRGGTVVCHSFEEDQPQTGRGDVLAGVADVAGDVRDWQGVTDSTDGPVFAAFAPAENLPWGVWVEVPRDAAAGPLRTWLGQTLLSAAAFAILAGVLALVFVRRLMRPIEDVAAATRAVAGGRYGDAVPVRGDDEIAELATSFNQMSQALQQSYAELDARVNQRTAELAASREFSDLLLDSMRAQILVLDADGRVVRANEVAEHAGATVGARAPEASRASAAEVLRTGVERREERAVSDRILAVEAYPLPTGDAVVEIARDITERTQLQARLMHQEKMASLGTLAAGLAHEIGNPLASMSSELEMLERMWDPDEARASLPVLRDQVRRMSSMLRELVEYGRRPSDEIAAFAARTVLDDVARLLRHDPRSRGVTVHIDDAATRPVHSSRDRLLQVLVNLGLNALDALDGTGTLTLSAHDHDGGVRFAVVDDGPGVPAELRTQVFDPFFTTKPPGRGAGLGLFVSERIVQRLGGRLELTDAEPRGAAFSVVLPRKEAA